MQPTIAAPSNCSHSVRFGAGEGLSVRGGRAWRAIFYSFRDPHPTNTDAHHRELYPWHQVNRNTATSDINT
jgi:hypothetical protein